MFTRGGAFIRFARVCLGMVGFRGVLVAGGLIAMTIDCLWSRFHVLLGSQTTERGCSLMFDSGYDTRDRHGLVDSFPSYTHIHMHIYTSWLFLDWFAALDLDKRKQSESPNTATTSGLGCYRPDGPPPVRLSSWALVVADGYASNYMPSGSPRHRGLGNGSPVTAAALGAHARMSTYPIDRSIFSHCWVMSVAHRSRPFITRHCHAPLVTRLSQSGKFGHESGVVVMCAHACVWCMHTYIHMRAHTHIQAHTCVRGRRFNMYLAMEVRRWMDAVSGRLSLIMYACSWTGSSSIVSHETCSNSSISIAPRGWHKDISRCCDSCRRGKKGLGRG